MVSTSHPAAPRTSTPTSSASTTPATRTSGVRGQITFVAMRDVPAGAELTIDYAMIDGDPAERMACACGAPECRTIITGSDWRLKELQRRYSGYFSRYIHDRFVADGG